MTTGTKSAQLQIRVSPAQKAAIRQAAKRAGIEMSAYVLARALPALACRFADLTDACRDVDTARYGLAELNAWLSALTGAELREAVAAGPASELSPFHANYIAAMVECACARRGVAPPRWTQSIAPLPEPAFGSTLVSLRLHLLANSPPPFRRRNIYIDASIGDRI